MSCTDVFKAEEPKIKYEYLAEDTYRYKVYGGWVIESYRLRYSGGGISTVFIPDPEYKWRI